MLAVKTYGHRQSTTSEIFPDITEERRKIAGLAWELGGGGLDDVEPEELEEPTASHWEELTEKELEDIIKFSEEAE